MVQTVLVLGGGTGGIVTANELARMAGNDGDINPLRIILFEKEEKHVKGPLLLWLMSGKRAPDEISRSTIKLAGNGIEVVIGEIESIDPGNITVKVNGQVYQGDHMVVSLGMVQKTNPVLQELGYNFHTVEGAEALHQHLQTFKGGNVAVVVPSLPYKGPTSPYQAAMLIEGILQEQGLAKSSQVSLYSPESEPLDLYSEPFSSSVYQLLAQRNIKYYPNYKLLSATADTLRFENGETASYDLLVHTPKFECPDVILNSALAGDSGWIEVDPHYMETDFKNVYAIGDIINIQLPVGEPLPKTGVVAARQGKVVAYNIVQKAFETGSKLHTYDGDGELFFETGDGKAEVVEGHFYAWPYPVLNIKKPDQISRFSKVLSEKYWWFRYF